MDNKYILGIHDGHNCGATLIKDGFVISSISEERLTRKKNELGYPKLSIEAIIKESGISTVDINRVAIASNFMHSPNHLKNITPWYRVNINNQKRDIAIGKDYDKSIFRLRQEERIEQVINHLDIDASKIEFIEHHLGHAAAAYFGSNFVSDEKILIFTCDGSGDNLCATVSIGKSGQIDRISSTNKSKSLGKVYSRITYLLGMEPWEHEYKVMGMAPYADKEGRQKAKLVFEELLGFNKDALEFELKSDLEMHYCYTFLRDRLENIRFDAIAGGLQDFTEEILEKWIESWIKKTGIKKLACGGGVFMNVKANLKIANIKNVEELYVFPSCADESLSIGAAYQEYFKYYQKISKIYPFNDIYCGLEYDNNNVKNAIDDYCLSDNCKIEFIEDIDDHIGIELGKNKIIARFQGKMEWGARALGNRSILANGCYIENVKIINKMIKQRDFWMPFAPSIMAERTNDYLYNPPNHESPYMMFAFKGKLLAEKDLVATMHPYDSTMRPQIVKKQHNKRYYAVLKSYEKETGMGGILNTSFNLHGYPIVCSPKDALEVFLNSDLQHLAIENYYITKNN